MTTSNGGATKQPRTSAPLRLVSRQGGHDVAFASRGWGITRPLAPRVTLRGIDSSCLERTATYHLHGFPPDGYRIVVADDDDTSTDTDD